jgi:hypothetical protein
MKTKNILVSVLLVFIIGNLHAGEGDSEAVARAKRELESKINELMYIVPFDDTIGDEKECRLTLTFRVNDQAEVCDCAVSGENKELVSWVNTCLYNKKIEADPLLIGKKYRVPVSFINEKL